MPDTTPRTVLQVTDLRFAYPRAQVPAVDIHTLTLKKGEQVALTGSSGSGKSTLLHLLAGLMEPSRGQIIIDGVELGSLTGSRRDRFRGRHIGMVFQTFQLLHGFTALENVLAALMFSDAPRGAHRNRARSLLASLGITTPESRVEQLSVGQQQRVAVARAVACSPSIVLADEPTAALDPEFKSVALGLLQQACRESGAALLCVTHDMGVVDRFDRHQRLSELGAAAPQHATAGSTI